MSGNERPRELRRRRHRTKKIAILGRKAKSASVSEKQVIAAKLRKLTIGSEQIIERLGLVSRN
ncbi:MAG TPA: DUF6800 family protein [Pirellulaceae bacterium]